MLWILHLNLNYLCARGLATLDPAAPEGMVYLSGVAGNLGGHEIRTLARTLLSQRMISQSRTCAYSLLTGVLTSKDTTYRLPFGLKLVTTCVDIRQAAPGLAQQEFEISMSHS